MENIQYPSYLTSDDYEECYPVNEIYNYKRRMPQQLQNEKKLTTL